MRTLALAVLVAPLAALAQPFTPAPDAFAALERGIEAYQQEDLDAAKAAFEEAYRLDTLFVDPAYNLGVLATQADEFPSAIAWYRRALAAADATTPSAPTDSLAVEWAVARSNVTTGLLIVGARLVQEDRLGEALGVFETILAAQPENRDALYNHALVLYRQENWDALVPVATRLTEVDPLNENAYVILFNAHKGIADATGEDEPRMQALAALEASSALPVFLDGIQFEQDEGVVTLRGTVIGSAATAGEPVPITFDLVGPFGPIGSGTATVTAPERGRSEPFELTIPTDGVIATWRYRVGA